MGRLTSIAPYVRYRTDFEMMHPRSFLSMLSPESKTSLGVVLVTLPIILLTSHQICAMAYPANRH
jgi:hypothetical protein